jgi:hypothetical protein
MHEELWVENPLEKRQLGKLTRCEDNTKTDIRETDCDVRLG